MLNECAAAAGVDIRKTRAVAEGLGARDFRERPFFPDPYSVLNQSWSMAVESVVPTLSDAQLKATHRQLQIKYHPDRHASTFQSQPHARHSTANTLLVAAA